MESANLLAFQVSIVSCEWKNWKIHGIVELHWKWWSCWFFSIHSTTHWKTLRCFNAWASFWFSLFQIVFFFLFFIMEMHFKCEKYDFLLSFVSTRNVNQCTISYNILALFYNMTVTIYFVFYQFAILNWHSDHFYENTAAAPITVTNEMRFVCNFFCFLLSKYKQKLPLLQLIFIFKRSTITYYY